MDHLFALALALTGIIGFVLWIFRPQSPLIIRIVVAVPSILWLIVYGLVELLRSEPTLWSGKAEMSYATLFLISIGLYVLIFAPAKKPPQPPADGGKSSA